MLSTSEIAAHLERFTYKPGWSFEVFDDAWEGQKLRIVATGLPDSYRPGDLIDLGVDSFLPPLMDAWDLRRWLMWRILRIENHEAREFFKVDGRIIWDPHADQS